MQMNGKDLESNHKITANPFTLPLLFYSKAFFITI